MKQETEFLIGKKFPEEEQLFHGIQFQYWEEKKSFASCSTFTFVTLNCVTWYKFSRAIEIKCFYDFFYTTCRYAHPWGEDSFILKSVFQESMIIAGWTVNWLVDWVIELYHISNLVFPL